MSESTWDSQERKERLIDVLTFFCPLLIIFPITFNQGYAPIGQQEIEENQVKYNQITECLSNLEGLSSVAEYNHYLLKQSNDCLKSSRLIPEKNKAYQNLLKTEEILAKNLPEINKQGIQETIILNKDNLLEYGRKRYPVNSVSVQIAGIILVSIIYLMLFWTLILLPAMVISDLKCERELL